MPGVKGSYLFKPVLLGRLLQEQKKVTKRLLATLDRKPKEEAPSADPALTTSPRLLTREALMQALAMSEEEMLALADEGMPALHLPSGPRFLFDEVVAWLRHRQEPSRVQPKLG